MWVCVCTMINSSSRGTGEAGLISPSEWSDEAFLFLFFAPTSVIVLEVEKNNKARMNIWQNDREINYVIMHYFQPCRSWGKPHTYFGLVLHLLLFPLITAHPATPVVPPGVFTLLFLFAPPAVLGVRPPDTGLFFLLPPPPPPLDFFFVVDTTVKVPPDSGELCVFGSSSWFRTLGRFFSPRALARAIASATMRLAFSCLQRTSTRRTDADSPWGALVIRMVWEGEVVVTEGPAAEALVTFITETVPPAVDAELVCAKEVVKIKESSRGVYIAYNEQISVDIWWSTCGCRSILRGIATLCPPWPCEICNTWGLPAFPVPETSWYCERKRKDWWFLNLNSEKLRWKQAMEMILKWGNSKFLTFFFTLTPPCWLGCCCTCSWIVRTFGWPPAWPAARAWVRAANWLPWSTSLPPGSWPNTNLAGACCCCPACPDWTCWICVTCCCKVPAGPATEPGCEGGWRTSVMRFASPP